MGSKGYSIVNDCGFLVISLFCAAYMRKEGYSYMHLCLLSLGNVLMPFVLNINMILWVNKDYNGGIKIDIFRHEHLWKYFVAGV